MGIRYSLLAKGIPVGLFLRKRDGPKGRGMAAPKREKLLEKAQQLFATEGFKGVSVDRLLEQAGVAKMTLYKAFPTKEALMMETLRRRDVALRERLQTALASHRSGLRAIVSAYFDALESWSRRPEFNGCYFVSALSEFGENEPAAQLAREHKVQMLAMLAAACREAGAEKPEELAADLRLIVEGASVSKQTLGAPDAFARAKRIALSQLRDGEGADL